MTSWQSELMSSEFYQQQTGSSIFLTEPVLEHRNNLHGIYVENEKEFSHDWVTETLLEVVHEAI